MRLLAPLTSELKLELISKLLDSVKSDKVETTESRKRELLYKLSGSWSDVDDSIIEEIYSARSYSEREIDLDA